LAAALAPDGRRPEPMRSSMFVSVLRNQRSMASA
jgi:hypothetical protein